MKNKRWLTMVIIHCSFVPHQSLVYLTRLIFTADKSDRIYPQRNHSLTVVTHIERAQDD